MIARTFIPSAAQRVLRERTRQQISLVQERAHGHRVQNVLEDANITLGDVATNGLGVCARAMIEALLMGETDPCVLAELAQGRLRAKRAGSAGLGRPTQTASLFLIDGTSQPS